MSLQKSLSQALNEKDVENVYRSELLKMEGVTITSPYAVDGLLETKNVRSLLEFKYQEQLKNKLSQCSVLVQCLYYIKKFETNGEKLPSTIFVGDRNECFAVHTNSIVKYLSHEVDWKIAPSEAAKKNPDLLQAMVGDTNILPFVYDVSDNFSVKTVFEKIKDFSDNVVRKVRVTQHNIVTIFDYFDKNVLGKVSLTTNEKANLFIQIIINQNENYLHPKRKNTLTTKSFGDLSVNQNLFNSFFQHFEGDVYSPKEKESLTALVDRLIEDSIRRHKGEFFTPTPFVDLAHKYISDTFGLDWKEKYVVWDCAWGTGNLTRDYKFKELYCSTLEQSDIDTANQMGYNPEATKFKFDFLNDRSNILPQGLQDAITQGKEILFLINPPYASVQSFENITSDGGKSKKGVENTKIKELMNSDNMSYASKNLYTQFMYRILNYNKNNNIKICQFSPVQFLTGSDFKNFRGKLFSTHKYSKGFMFDAKNFADVSSWGLLFSIFSDGDGDKINFGVDLIDVDAVDFELKLIDSKLLYNLDGSLGGNTWVKNDIKGLKCDIDLPKLSSAIKVKQKGYSNMCDGGFGYFYTAGNNIYYNKNNVSYFSSCFSNKCGVPVTGVNFMKTATFFTSRVLLSGDYAKWHNLYDEYMAPNETHSLYEQFNYDSIVYSLFNNKSQQSSLRQVDYKDKKWDIKNEFFWLSKSEMQQMGEDNHYDELYKDAKNGDERFVHKKLFVDGIYDKLSPDAKAVLDMATELVKKSILMRQMISEQHPEYHLDSFDAGYAQLKLVWKDYFKEEFKAFRDAYKAFEDRLRPQVYELGFLKQ